MTNLSELTDKLEEAVEDLELKKNKLKNCEAELANASSDYNNALYKAQEFRNELDKILNSLVPLSMQGRVRSA
jgi:chaperonin cofactor prefoldin